MTDCTSSHKRGDSFDAVVAIPAFFADGYFADFDVVSQIRTPGGVLVGEFECSWVDAVTTRALRLVCINTRNWPVGPAEIDVEFTRRSDGFVYSTQTEQIYVLRDVTEPQP